MQGVTLVINTADLLLYYYFAFIYSPKCCYQKVKNDVFHVDIFSELLSDLSMPVSVSYFNITVAMDAGFRHSTRSFYSLKILIFSLMEIKFPPGLGVRRMTR